MGVGPAGLCLCSPRTWHPWAWQLTADPSPGSEDSPVSTVSLSFFLLWTLREEVSETFKRLSSSKLFIAALKLFAFPNRLPHGRRGSFLGAGCEHSCPYHARSD